MTIAQVRKAFAYKGPRGRSRAEIRAAAELCRAAQGLAFAILRIVPKGHNQDLAIARLKNSMTPLYAELDLAPLRSREKKKGKLPPLTAHEIADGVTQREATAEEKKRYGARPLRPREGN